MSPPTILFFGSPGHPVLEPLYQYLRERQRRRVVFVPQEKFPREVEFGMGAGQDDPPGWIVPPYEEAVPFEDICGVCLDGYVVSPDRFADLEERDVPYAQAETWAALIALFGRLSRSAIVANHVTRRNHVASRAAQLAFLARHGLTVPRILVTSQPEAARAFFEETEGRTIYKPVGGSLPCFKAMEACDLHRLEAIRLAPVHFEESPVGDVVQAVVIGQELLTIPSEETIPSETARLCVQACRALDLWMAQVSFRRGPQGHWVATGLVPHLGAESLGDARIREAAATLLEEGASRTDES